MTIKNIRFDDHESLEVICDECGSENVDHADEIIRGVRLYLTYICLDCEALIEGDVPMRCDGETIFGATTKLCSNNATKIVGNDKLEVYYLCDDHYMSQLEQINSSEPSFEDETQKEWE